MQNSKSLRISVMPSYESVRNFMQILDGLPTQELSEMEKNIGEFGEQKAPPLDWTEPGRWIDDMPDGKSKDLARRIWGQTDHYTNPRYLQAEKTLIRQYRLVEERDSVYVLTQAGKDFVRDADGKAVTFIDKSEGIIAILGSLVIRGVSKSTDISDDFEKSLAELTDNPPKAPYKYLISRLNNLVTRKYINRAGNFYDISTVGRRYLEKLDPQNRLQRIAEDANRKNVEAVQQLHKALHKMDPFDFESLVAELFRRMDYDNVEDLQKTHDGGVDVIAEKDFGFGSEKVVIQVKRHSHGLGRAVVSQLRDDIRAFSGATRGIIVTTSKFNNDAEERANEPGEIPITLIDGEKLINMMISNKLGIIPQPVTYYDFNPEYLVVKADPKEEIS